MRWGRCWSAITAAERHGSKRALRRRIAANLPLTLSSPKKGAAARIEARGGGGSLAGVMVVHFLGDILEADIHFVNLLVLFDGFLFFAHFFQDGTQGVSEVHLFLVENQFFRKRFLQGFGGEVVHVAAGEALAQAVQGGDA